LLKSLFLSKNQKLVKLWEQEHKDIGALAGQIIGAYEKNDMKSAKKHLNTLNSLTVGHLMKEDLAFYNLLKYSSELDEETIEHIKEFRETFKGTKTALMNFIGKYASDAIELDDEFIEAFKGLVGVVVQRIDYEETNLYQVLSDFKE
jgi:hypothetical protein